MHVVVSTVHKANKSYRYARIVQSYRRPKDGMPAQKIIANLGDLPQVEIDNLRAAFSASRSGQRVVVAPETAEHLDATPVLANLRYLSVVVALRIWRDWGLPELLQRVVAGDDADVSAQDVIASLSVHRCVAPGSKLHAERWFPTTAIPELLGISPSKFNNSRLHRVLTKLEACEETLQENLAQRYHTRDGAFVSLFMDVTDTWFVGHGPELAEKSRTKEGLYRRRVNILLLCNERGYPLRWRVLSGKSQDAPAMKGMARELRDCSWVGDAPLVCDRSMGQEGGVDALLECGLRFLTAVPKSEFGGYTDRIPHERFTDLSLGGSEQSEEVDIRLARRTAKDAGLRRVADDLYVLDLGVIEKGGPAAEAKTEREITQYLDGVTDPARDGLALGELIRYELDTGEVTTYREAGQRHGIHKTYASQLAGLLRLSADIQTTIREGNAIGVPKSQLVLLSRIDDPEQQRQRFDQLLRDRKPRKQRQPTRPSNSAALTGPAKPKGVRGVLYFNPEMFVGQRRRADQTLSYIHAAVRELNLRLASPHSRRGEASVSGEAMNLLRQKHLVDVFSIQVHRRLKGGRSYYEVEIMLQEDEWRKRRRFDGFSLLVGHPELPHSAAQLAELFRAKDAVEKDFQTIKSVLKLRPVRHRTDPKVRAHVSLCMLALLLERTLELRLAKAGLKYTAQAAFEILSTCHLNQQAALGGVMPLYTVTRATPEQLAILGALDALDLVDDRKVGSAITPR